MSKYKFLYIDDENDPSTAAIADGLNDTGLIQVDFDQPKDFKTQKNVFSERLEYYNGIILDLRLDGKHLDISYNAPAIAQELRMMAAQGAIKSCPIILCSTEEKMRATYDVDKTSHDLFDYKFQKQDSPPWKKFAKKIASLAQGYDYINQSKFDLNKILSRDIDSLDSRIFESVLAVESPMPTFGYSAFVIKNLFHSPGPLIKEKLLAARLGVDINKSGESWFRLLDEMFMQAKYVGAFSDGWSRWWQDIVMSIFKERSGKRLSTLNAKERVAILKDLTGIKQLEAADPLPRSNSTNFWTICEFYKMPLDPLEGFRVFTSIEPKAWQEHKYISLDAVLRKKGPRPHPTELTRIEAIKESLSK